MLQPKHHCRSYPARVDCTHALIDRLFHWSWTDAPTFAAIYNKFALFLGIIHPSVGKRGISAIQRDQRYWSALFVVLRY
jgi:hypothetical protein